MNILFISEDLTGINLACKLVEEENNLRFFDRNCYWGRKIKRPGISFTNNWENELKWVGKKGLIVFDYSGMAKIQDDLRKKGYSVFGSSELGEKIENNRQYGQKMFSLFGMKIKRSIDFYDIKEAINFVSNNPGKWVVKQNGNMDKVFNYVGDIENGDDVKSVLGTYRKILKGKKVHFDLQEKIDGIEIALGKYFNGNDWLGPICMNVEHKGLFNSNLGPKGEEMGSLVWYENKDNKLFEETVGKAKDFLRSINYHGYFDINCIVTKENAYPLESTSRLAYPTTQAQLSLLVSPWGEFMKSIADGKKFNVKFKKDYAVLVFLGTPPYPYKNRSSYNSPYGLEVIFKEGISKSDFNNIYLEEVSCISRNGKGLKYSIVSKTGYIAHVNGVEKTIKKAREKAYKLISKVVIPKVFYRTDIGLKFMDEDQKKLKRWGWI